MSDQKTDAPLSLAALDKLLEQLRSPLSLREQGIVKILEPCIQGTHNFSYLSRKEIEEPKGSTVYGENWCQICGSTQSFSQRVVGGLRGVPQNVRISESDIFEAVKKIFPKSPSSGA